MCCLQIHVGRAPLLALALLVVGCRAGGPDLHAPTEMDLLPYDFDGHTAVKLRHLCQIATKQTGHRAARMHLLCGRTLLDWYLGAALREDGPSLAKLGRQLGVDAAGPGEKLSADLVPQILTALARHFSRAMEQGRGGSLAPVAAAGYRLVLLHRDESRRWGYRYLVGLGEAARSDGPFEVQARVIIAGAALDGLKAIRRASRPQRREILIRGLGFSCPAEGDPGDGSETTPRKPTCPLVCPDLKQEAYRLSPARRKALVAAKCPLSHLGLSQREHGVYLSRETMLVARAVSYQLHNLHRLTKLAPHPLIQTVRGALHRLKERLNTLRVALPLPDMSPGETNHIQVPLCASANDTLKAAVYVALDETHLFAGPVPVLGVRAAQVEIFDQLEGYTFPGRQIWVADAQATTTALTRLRQVWKRITRAGLPAPRDRVAIYADASLTAGRFNDLLDLLFEVGVRHADLVLRNTQGELGTVPVEISGARRSEGPPLPRTGPSVKPTALQLSLSHRRMRLTARSGPLARSRIDLPANDLAGLRETLQHKTWRVYRNSGGITVRVSGEVRYLEISRLLHFLRRNSSGRILYDRLVL